MLANVERRPTRGRGARPGAESEYAVVAVCRTPRSAGADAALAIADEVAALFRGRTFGRLGFDAPSIDLDGRDPDSFRAVVTLPIRQDTGWPSRPSADATCTSGR